MEDSTFMRTTTDKQDKVNSESFIQTAVFYETLDILIENHDPFGSIDAFAFFESITPRVNHTQPKSNHNHIINNIPVAKTVMTETTNTDAIPLAMPLLCQEIIVKKGNRFCLLGTCRKRKNKKRIEPQLPEDKRPSKLINHPLGYVKEGDMYQCQLCPRKAKKSNTIQQHCLCHFPARWECDESTLKCDGCSDGFILKTSYINHFDVQCLECDKVIKRSSIPSHSCKYKFKKVSK